MGLGCLAPVCTARLTEKPRFSCLGLFWVIVVVVVLRFIFLLFTCMNVYECTWYVGRSEEGVGSPEQELQTVASGCVNAENGTQVLRKSSRRS